MASRIRTTVVGSYPVLPWMVGNSSRLVLRDAIMAVLKTQELAGLDLVSDGELGRFDPSNPETNGIDALFDEAPAPPPPKPAPAAAPAAAPSAPTAAKASPPPAPSAAQRARPAQPAGAPAEGGPFWKRWFGS